MLFITSIQCPNCLQYKGSLKCWKKIATMYFHLCEECCDKNFSKDELLVIGYRIGLKDEKFNIKKLIDDYSRKEGHFNESFNK